MQSDVGVDPGEFSRQLMRSARKVAESDSAVPEQQLEPVRILEEAYEQTKSTIGAPLARACAWAAAVWGACIFCRNLGRPAWACLRADHDR